MATRKYKFQQVLRTKVPLRIEGRSIPTNTRCVAMAKTVPAGQVKVAVADPANKKLSGFRFISKIGAFKTTNRGRPVAA